MKASKLPPFVAVKLGDVPAGQTCVYFSWQRGREVRVVAHDDCNLTTLQNLRTGSTWTVTSFTQVYTTESVRKVYAEAHRLGIGYIGPRMNGQK